ncbi:AAA family ATPase [Mucilaginibacter myungsuensis]|uniref:AAA family ATPase n=1 Tax=Mucilaginibacter myungsuensis TaxID=649104 RepID=A0A929PYS4_9SPHI|nr:AAA family ATPase [Mucilaginibacter myungsuensis]MBE9663637.1 AAA family ATPase [Mucilaginibacter myungsuensis]MDN3599039.1 AAA family ATPase [Mucilaginibacter myungsuensis]
MPLLSYISLPPLHDGYLQNIPSLNKGLNLKLTTNVTFLVGENGSGKSTLLEAIAEQCGFSLRGGNRNHNLEVGWRFEGYKTPLARYLQLGFNPRRVTDGFFMRAESFFNFASYIDELAQDDNRILKAYGGRSLHEQSHGESFLALFNNQFENGLYLLDEPEAALSPARILAFMSVINELERGGRAQFIIATHSPMLICYPGATTLQFDNDGVRETTYEDTEHYYLTKSFLNNPSTYLHHLIDPGEDK